MIDHGHLRCTSETCSYRQRVPLRLHNAACYMYSKFNENYTSCSNFSLEIAKITTPVDLKVEFRFGDFAKFSLTSWNRKN